MKEFIQVACVTSQLFFFWQFDRDTYSPHYENNTILFAVAFVLTLLLGILEIREKQSPKKPWALWLSLITFPVFVFLLFQKITLNAYSIINVSMFGIVVVIPLVKHLMRKDRKS